MAQKAVAMVSSLESVKSICDFEYMDKEEGIRKLKEGKLYAVMEVPEGFVQDIMNGTNTPCLLYTSCKTRHHHRDDGQFLP